MDYKREIKSIKADFVSELGIVTIKVRALLLDSLPESVYVNYLYRYDYNDDEDMIANIVRMNGDFACEVGLVEPPHSYKDINCFTVFDAAKPNEIFKLPGVTLKI